MSAVLSFKLGLYLNVDGTRMWHAKTKWSFNLDVLSRLGKQHLAGWRTFDSQTLSVGCQYLKGNLHSIRLCRFICCLSECRTKYKYIIHSTSPRFLMCCSHSHSDVNAILKWIFSVNNNISNMTIFGVP